MAEPKCPSCQAAVVTVDEMPIQSQGAGECILLCCPACHAILGAVKSRPAEKVLEDAGRQAVDFFGKMAEKMQPK